jgi:prepilin-type N-terminal cleavage/methylation domain-containing protein
MRLRQHREGFTLIELLVAMAIIALLAGLTITLGPVLQRTQQASRGAEQVQGTIFAAKQTALRDQTLYGIRLLQDSDGNFRSMQYINQPDDYVRNRVSVDPANPTLVNFQSDISDGLGPDTTIWPVQVGDYIQIQSGPNPRRIVQINSNNQVVTASANAGPSTFTTDFKVFRGPRAVPGEEIILLPDDIIIDAGRSVITPDNNGQFNILFAPAGTVVGNAAQNGKIILWVRDVNTDPTTAREQSLIVVYTRPGSIASYAVDVGSADPYSFTYDSRPNGF